MKTQYPFSISGKALYLDFEFESRGPRDIIEKAVRYELLNRVDKNRLREEFFRRESERMTEFIKKAGLPDACYERRRRRAGPPELPPDRNTSKPH